MSNLPPGVEPHDSDPPEPVALEGIVRATVTMSYTCKVHRANEGRPWFYRCDECYTKDDAQEFAKTRLVGVITNSSRFTVADVELTDVTFEPD